jgi:NADH dehydrogenase/NADH:ubiquinone oxidoreductase subunit G
MANMVNLTIDGVKVQATQGTNLVDAAALNGIHIPNLCYLKGIKAVGACRLCLVEVSGQKAPVIACITKVKEGMEVNTKTERVLDLRKFVIDLIVSMHPLDCMTCTKAGVCNLQEYAYDFDIKESSFTRKSFDYPADTSNPLIKRDPEYCILCGRCVRICRQQDTNVLDFMGRGVGAKVVTAMEKPLQESGCTFCGSCLDVCPVNALVEADRNRKGREWEYDKVPSVCLLCGNSCDIVVSSKDGMVVKVNSDGEDGSSERYICAYGRFGFDCLIADTRVTTPMKKVNGKLVETTWEEAIVIAAKELKKAGAKAGFISTAGITNEDAYALNKLATTIVKTKNVDTTASLYGDKATLLSAQADIDSADMFVVVDLDPCQWKRVLPALDAIVRKKVNAGAKLVTINAGETGLGKAATVEFIGNEADLLKSFVKGLLDKGLAGDAALAGAVKGAAVSEEMEKAAALFAAAKNPVVFASPAMYQASANIALLKGTVVSVPVESNAKGVMLIGLTSKGKSYKEMAAGATNLLYAVGEVPLAERPNADFLIVQNSHLTELAKQADLVLPSAAFLEDDGSIVDYLGNLKFICQAIEPPGDAMAHSDIFAAIARAMGAKIEEADETELEKLVKYNVKASLSPFARKEGFDVNVNELIESINASVISGSRLFWLKQTEKAMV